MGDLTQSNELKRWFHSLARFDHAPTAIGETEDEWAIPSTPEMALWFGVLVDGLMCLKSPKKSVRLEAMEWMAGEHFEWNCSLFRLNADAVRDAMQRRLG